MLGRGGASQNGEPASAPARRSSANRSSRSPRQKLSVPIAMVTASATTIRFLNLFCYTASATVHAAAGGARSSLSLDLSSTYLDWAAQNFRVNQLTRDHELLQTDCREWLANERAARWDLIFLDPPTFSNSKRMTGILDTQRDHQDLIGHCMRLLAPAGLLVFSTNAQRFKLDQSISERWAVADISAATIPFDFQRNPRIHRAFELRARDRH